MDDKRIDTNEIKTTIRFFRTIINEKYFSILKECDADAFEKLNHEVKKKLNVEERMDRLCMIRDIYGKYLSSFPSYDKIVGKIIDLYNGFIQKYDSIQHYIKSINDNNFDLSFLDSIVKYMQRCNYDKSLTFFLEYKSEKNIWKAYFSSNKGDVIAYRYEGNSLSSVIEQCYIAAFMQGEDIIFLANEND